MTRYILLRLVENHTCLTILSKISHFCDLGEQREVISWLKIVCGEEDIF